MKVEGTFLAPAFVGQPVGVYQVGELWIDDSGATYHITNNAELIYDTSPPPPNRSRIILGDIFTKKKVEFIRKTLNLTFYIKINNPATLYDVSFVPGLGFNLFSFHVVKKKLRNHIEQKWLVASHIGETRGDRSTTQKAVITV